MNLRPTHEHRLFRRPVWIILAAISLSLLTRPPSASGWDGPDAGGRRVLVVSCDGLRPDAIGRADTPVLSGLIASGSYQATCLNEMPPVTLPNHTSMVTGRSVARHGVLANSALPGRVAATTIFDAAQSAGLRVGFFAGKEKLAYLCEQGSVDAWRVVSDVDALADAVAAEIDTGVFDLIFVHFAQPDGVGHSAGWMSDAYLAAVARVDAAIGRILDALDRAGVLDETVVIISADHGGHCQTHGFDIPEDRHIPFIINGPGVAAGRSLCRQVRIMDVAATALYLLGLPTETAVDGRPVTEALAETPQDACTAPTTVFTGLCAPLPLLCLLTTIALLAWRGQRGRTPGD